MKFLFLSGDSFPNPYLSLDLIFNYYLPRKGLEPVWIMPSDVIRPKKLLWRQNPLYLIPKYPSYHPLYPIKLGSMLKEVMEDIGKISFVWVRDNPIMALEGYRFARKRGIPFFYRISHLKEEESLLYSKMGICGPKWRNYLRGKVGKGLRDFLVRRADIVISISEKMGEYFKGKGAKKIFILPEGIDGRVKPEDYDNSAKILRGEMAPEGFLMVYVGVLSRFRGSFFLLDVLRRLPENYYLAIAGWGMPDDFVGEFLRKSEEFNINSRLRFLGFLPKEKVYSLIRASDVGLSPIPINTVYEASSPIKPLEYLLMERPVVSTPVPDTVNIIKNSGAGLISPMEPEAFASNIMKVVHIKDDLGRKGREYIIKERDMGNLAESLAMVIKNAL